MDNIKFKLNPNWLTGLVDGEGCFYIRFVRSKNYKLGWLVQASFQLGLHSKDKYLLLQIKSYFKDVGNIYTMNKGKVLLYQVRNLNDITKVIIPHFLKYPLITQKSKDFFLFKNIVELMNKREHLNKEGLMKIIAFKASLNNGLSNKLKHYFPEIIKIERSIINIPINIDYNWIGGFFTGEGCFSIIRNKPRITIGQHSRDRILINNLMKTLKCGFVSEYPEKRNFTLLTISKFEDIYNKIIPFFKKYKIGGVKALDFQDFCKVAELINQKTHLTPAGLNEIYNIKRNMNKSRY